MRAVVLCAALAAAVVPSSAGAQSLSLTESEALARLSADSPRVRAIRAGDRRRARRRAGGRPLAESAGHVRPRIGRRRHREHDDGGAAAADHRPARARRAGGVGAGRRRARAAPTTRCAALRADLRLAFAQLVAAQVRERELTAARDRLRELADVLAKREAAGDAAGFDRLRAEREVLDVDADRAAAATERARAQAIARELLRRRGRPVAHRRRRRRRPPRAPLPPVEALVEQAESIRGELLALRKEIDAARFVGAGGRSPARFPSRRSSPAPSRRRRAAATSAASSRVHATIPLFDRAQPERALAEARARQAEARAEAFRADAARGDRRASRGRRSSAARRPSAIARPPSPAPIRSSASRRSATTPASAASSNCSTRIAPAPRRACGRPRSTPPCGRRRSSWNSSAAGRFRNDDTTHARRSLVARRPRLVAGVPPQRRAADGRSRRRST